MDTNELTYILQELQFSAKLPLDVLEQLAEEASLRTISAGTVVFHEGTIDDNLYLVRNGRLALDMNVPGRGAVRILTLGRGEMFGWSSLMDHGKMTASAIAVEDTEILVAPAEKLRQLCEANCEFGYHLMRQMATALSRRLVSTRLQLLDLFADATAGNPPNRPEGAH